MTPPRRKKWTELEERTLIDQYNEMLSNGTLAKMKTREKKFKPIAYYINSLHNVIDPVAFPWQWTWKDVSTKVQNMRHQYLLVKQKIKKPSSDSCSEEFDWCEGLTHWSNFLRYKEVFGDVPLGLNGNENGTDGGMEIGEFGRGIEDGDFGVGMDGGDGDGVDGMLGLGFEYDARDVGESYNNHNENGEKMRKDCDSGFEHDEDANESRARKKRKIANGMEKKVLGFFARQLNELKKMETHFQQREAEREQERKQRDSVLIELELERVRRLEKCRGEREKTREELIKRRKEQWEVFEEENAARNRRKEEFNYENEWEERMNRRRAEWMKQMDEMLIHHREEMGQVQARILHEQQNLTNQFLGIVGQWTGHSTLLSDPTGQHSHYISQMMQNIHQESGIMRDDTVVDEGDNQDDQFVVD